MGLQEPRHSSAKVSNEPVPSLATFCSADTTTPPCACLSISLSLCLARYLCVQFVRFFFKMTPNSRDRAGVGCKILRVCNEQVHTLHLTALLPMVLTLVLYSLLFLGPPRQPVGFPADNMDVYQFCSPQLQARLKVWRDAHLAEQEKALADADKKAAGGDAKGAKDAKAATAAAPASAPASADEDVAMAGGSDDDEEDLAAALELSMAGGGGGAGGGAGASGTVQSVL